VPIANPQPILRWIELELQAGRTPHLTTNASQGVQLGRLAIEQGADLSGAQFALSGDLMTRQRLETIQRTGANVCPAYGSKESGMIASGCLNPDHPDDLHVYHDQHVLIQPGVQATSPELPLDALLISSLRLSWPFVLLNVSLGDCATLSQRACGCPMERLGWTSHLHTVRSFAKMKIGGVMVVGDGLIRLLEEVLPTRFGGGPTDYQLVEEVEDVVAGTSRLRLLVHPDAQVDNTDVATLFIDALQSEGVRVAELQRRPEWVSVERRRALVSDSGKLLPIHRL
jgi:hypothetical protein